MFSMCLVCGKRSNGWMSTASYPLAMISFASRACVIDPTKFVPRRVVRRKTKHTKKNGRTYGRQRGAVGVCTNAEDNETVT